MKNPLYAVVLVLTLLGAFTQLQSLSANSIDPWINEIHYDNSGSDVGEFVEVAGEAGTDLSGYSIILYNGNGGASYITSILTGVIGDESNGYGALEFSISGIQNGSPDGIALANSTGLLQFLSYEGSFTATNGAASSLTSTEIGVTETGSTPVGFSLQLTGLGSEYDDFTWKGPSLESPGKINAAQTFVKKAVPDSSSSAILLLLGLSGLALVRRRK